MVVIGKSSLWNQGRNSIEGEIVQYLVVKFGGRHFNEKSPVCLKRVTMREE